MSLDKEYKDFIHDLILSLSKGNPGACNVACNLIKYMQENEDKIIEVADYISQLLSRKIIGAKLWVLYRTEANKSISDMLQLDLNTYTSDYFKEKYRLD
jgi:hypothetical protein